MNRSRWVNMARTAAVLAMGAAALAAAGCGSGARGDRGLFKVAGQPTPATVAAFERLKALAGEWESTGDHPGTTIFAVSSNGSVVREIMLPGTDSEMTNLYHMDGPDLVVTHYCAIGNQPRMRARPSDVSADRIAFGPDGVTNLRSEGEMYMGQLTLVFTGPDTLRQEWRTFKQGELNEDHAVFEMRRRPRASAAPARPDGATTAVLGAVLAAQPADKPAHSGKGRPMNDEITKQDEAMAAMNPLTPEHKMLADGCGTYDLTMTISPMGGASEPIVIKAVTTREMILGGKFRLERTESTAGSMPYSAISIVGFNRDAEAGPRFEITRYSSTVSCTLPETGTYDAATRTFTTSGEHEVNGMRGKMRVVHTLLDGGKEKAEVYLAMEGYADAYKGMKIPEYKAMVLEFTKRN